MVQQPTEDQGLPINCKSHICLSEGRGDQPPRQYNNDTEPEINNDFQNLYEPYAIYIRRSNC